MELPAIFSATLGLSSPWKVVAVTFAKDVQRLDITVAFETGNPGRCPRCDSFSEACHETATSETWHHQNFFNYATYLHTRVPQIKCGCGRYPVALPWARHGSKFVKIV